MCRLACVESVAAVNVVLEVPCALPFKERLHLLLIRLTFDWPRSCINPDAVQQCLLVYALADFSCATHFCTGCVFVQMSYLLLYRAERA